MKAERVFSIYSSPNNKAGKKTISIPHVKGSVKYSGLMSWLFASSRKENADTSTFNLEKISSISWSSYKYVRTN